MRRGLFVAAVVLLLSGCQGGLLQQGEAITIARVVLRNQTDDDLTAVRISVPATGAIVSCGRLLAGSECTTTFPIRHYRGEHFTISWQLNGEPMGEYGNRLALPDPYLPGRTATAVITFAGEGKALAELFHFYVSPLAR